jgi:hypothetical protein
MCHFYYVLKCSAGTGFQFAGPGSQGPVPPGEVTNNLQFVRQLADGSVLFSVLVRQPVEKVGVFLHSWCDAGLYCY